MLSRKIVTAIVVLFSLSEILVYLLIDFYLFVARTALKLRPELISLTLWEAMWTGHLTDWLWLMKPTTALLLNVVMFGVVGVVFGYYVGKLWDIWS